MAYQLASPGRDCDRPSAAGPQQANTGNRNDVISLMSSVETTRAEELSGDDESDDEVTMMSHSLGEPRLQVPARSPLLPALRQLSSMSLSRTRETLTSLLRALMTRPRLAANCQRQAGQCLPRSQAAQ